MIKQLLKAFMVLGIMFVSFVATQAQPGDPCSGTQPYTYTIDYSAGQYYISTPLIGCSTLTFSGAAVNGWTSTTSCSGGAVESDSMPSFVVNGSTDPDRGGYSGSINGSTPLTCTSKKFKTATSVIVNGVSRTNGSTFTINGANYKVIINHTSCSNYPC
jgi:hypothetical protein